MGIEAATEGMSAEEFSAVRASAEDHNLTAVKLAIWYASEAASGRRSCEDPEAPDRAGRSDAARAAAEKCVALAESPSGPNLGAGEVALVEALAKNALRDADLAAAAAARNPAADAPADDASSALEALAGIATSTAGSLFFNEDLDAVLSRVDAADVGTRGAISRFAKRADRSFRRSERDLLVAARSQRALLGGEASEPSRAGRDSPAERRPSLVVAPSPEPPHREDSAIDVELLKKDETVWISKRLGFVDAEDAAGCFGGLFSCCDTAIEPVDMGGDDLHIG